MRRGILLLGLLCVASVARAVDLAVWTFEISQPSTWGPNYAEGGLNATASAYGFHSATGTFSSPSGNGSAHSFSSDNWSVGDSYTFIFSTFGYQDISLSFDQTSSNSGPRDFKVQYSANGATYFDALDYTVLTNSSANGGSWNGTTMNSSYTTSLSLSSATILNGQALAYIRLTNRSTVSANGGTVGISGTSRVDNVRISANVAQAVPEPFTMGLGLAAAGVFVRRRMARKSG